MTNRHAERRTRYGAFHLLISAASLVLCCTGCGPKNEPTPAANWSVYKYPEGGCKVLFPVPPSYTVSSDGKEQRHTAQYREGKRLLRVSFERDFDTSVPIANRFAEVAKLPKVRGAVTTSNVVLGPHQGMEAKYAMETEGKTLNFRHRIFHVGTSSYTLMSVTAVGENADGDIERFFGSLELLP